MYTQNTANKSKQLIIFNNNTKCMRNGYYVPGTALNILPILTHLNLQIPLT